MKLRTKFALSTFLLITTILCGVAFFLFLAEKRHLEQKLYEQMDIDIQKFAKICRESLLTRQDITLLNYVNTLKQNVSTSHVIFTDSSGKVLMHDNLAFRGRFFKSPISIDSTDATALRKLHWRNKKNEYIIEVTLPVYLGNEKAGVARIGFERGELEKSVSTVLVETAHRIGKVALIGIIVGLVISYLFVLKMTRPIRELAQGARIIGEGKLEHRIAIKSRDELGELSKDFNEMAEKLAEIDRLKDEFVDTVSHELRSPLAAIRGYIQGLQKGIYGPLVDRQGEALGIVMSNALRLGRFIDDVLDMAKIRAGMYTLDKKEVDLGEIAKEIITMFEPLAAEMGLRLVLDCPATLPKIVADSVRLKEVVTNLASNAMKFTPSGGSVSVIARPKDDAFVTVEVRDTGVGIPKDKLSSVFEKFTQVKEAQQTSTKIKGTGLGLTIAKTIVELHGGTIWIESEEGKGTSFFFTVPCVNSPVERKT